MDATNTLGVINLYTVDVFGQFTLSDKHCLDASEYASFCFKFLDPQNLQENFLDNAGVLDEYYVRCDGGNYLSLTEIAASSCDSNTGQSRYTYNECEKAPLTVESACTEAVKTLLGHNDFGVMDVEPENFDQIPKTTSSDVDEVTHTRAIDALKASNLILDVDSESVEAWGTLFDKHWNSITTPKSTVRRTKAPKINRKRMRSPLSVSANGPAVNVSKRAMSPSTKPVALALNYQSASPRRKRLKPSPKTRHDDFAATTIKNWIKSFGSHPSVKEPLRQWFYTEMLLHTIEKPHPAATANLGY